MAGLNWDLIISFSIIIGLILALWARIGNQTIMELIRDIGDYFREVKENSIERGVDL